VARVKYGCGGASLQGPRRGRMRAVTDIRVSIAIRQIPSSLEKSGSC
jgi:hypothetical protein